MKRYTILAGSGVLRIIDPDFNTSTFVEFDGKEFVYNVTDSEGTTIQFGRHENLSDLETMVDLDTNDISMIETLFLGDDK